MNIQHLESLSDAVATITGAPVNERLPDDVLLRADEIELVDMSPHALRQRMRHGNVYPPDRAHVALEHFFTEANLTALRELSLRAVAQRVEDQLEGANHATLPLVSERVMVLVDGSPRSGRAVRRAASLAGAIHAGLVALVPPAERVDDMPFDTARNLREALEVAVELGARTAQLGAGRHRGGGGCGRARPGRHAPLRAARVARQAGGTPARVARRPPLGAASRRRHPPGWRELSTTPRRRGGAPPRPLPADDDDERGGMRRLVEMGESRTPRPEPFARTHYERVRCFSSAGRRPSAGFHPAHSRVPRSGLAPGYVTSSGVAPSLSDTSTAREGEAASMLTLPPKRRGREQAACWQLLRFAAGLTRPDGTSARVPWQPSPVETTHPHRTEPPFGARILAPASMGVERGAAADRGRMRPPDACGPRTARPCCTPAPMSPPCRPPCPYTPSNRSRVRVPLLPR